MLDLIGPFKLKKCIFCFILCFIIPPFPCSSQISSNFFKVPPNAKIYLLMSEIGNLVH